MRTRLIATSRFAWRWLRRALIGVACLLLAVAGGFTAYALLALPALEPWHTDVLDGEFDADAHAALDFAGYQALEAALFEQSARWIAEQTGHPRLRARHLPFPIASRERDEWLLCMAQAMSDRGVVSPLFERLLQAFHGTADWMRNRPDV